MQTALDALAHGVQTLFSGGAEPPRRRRPRQGDHALRQHHHHHSQPPQYHPLCECLKLQPLPEDWTHLQRHPVLKQHVLTQWTQQCDDLVGRRQEQGRGANITTVTSLSSSAYAKDRAVVVQCVHSLCVLLFQCGLLHVRELEFVQLLVRKTFHCGLGDVLLTQQEQRGTRLPMRARMLLIQLVLQLVCKRALHEDVAVLKLMEDLCTSLHEEIRELVAATTKLPPIDDGVVKRTIRQTVWVGAKESVRGQQLIYDEAGVCEFCQREERPHQGTKALPSAELQGLKRTVQSILQAFESGDQRQGKMNKTVKALAALRNLLARPDVTLFFRSREHEVHRSSIYPFASGAFTSNRLIRMNPDWRISMSKYAQISRMTLSQGVASKHMNAMLWEKVHEKELQRCLVSHSTTPRLSLHQAILCCAKTDLFASIQRPIITTADLPGYRVISQVLQTLQVNWFEMILVFKSLWEQCSAPGVPGHSRNQIDASNGTLLAVVRSYLANLLSDFERQCFANPAEESDFDIGVQNGTQLLHLVYSLYVLFSSSSHDPNECTYYAQWDRLFGLNGLYELHSSGEDVDALGVAWLRGFSSICEAIEDAGNEIDVAFKTAYLNYVQGTIRIIAAENGASISSGGLTRRPLAHNDEQMDLVRQLISSIVESCGSAWLCELVTRMLSSHIHPKRRAWGTEIEVSFRRGLKSILFPALDSHIERISTQSADELRSNKESLFFDIVFEVSEKLRIANGSCTFVGTLVHFCAEWDAFDAKKSKNGDASRKWGRASFIRLKLLPELLSFYESDETISQGTPDALSFLEDVLQNETSCPPSLEGKLFTLLCSIKSRLEGSHKSWSHADSRLLPVVSHSDGKLAKFMYEVSTGNILQTRTAMENMREDQNALDELVLHLKRWIGLMELHDPRAAAAGKESKRNVAVLCNKLMCWLPDEYLRDLRQAVTPVTSKVSALLSSFANEDHGDDERVGGVIMSSSSGAASIVRLELSLRSYLYSSVVPDLCELTDILINSILECTSMDTREALLKLTQRNSTYMLVEVALEALRLVISSECLQYMEPTGTEEEQEDRPDPPLNRLSNALYIAASAPPIFGSSDITWSVSMFDVQAVQHWLMCFYDCIVHTGESRARIPIHELLSSLGALIESPVGTHMVSHSYLLVALLCTASFPQSRALHAVRNNDLNAALEKIAAKFLSVLSPPHTIDAHTEREGSSEDESELLVVQLEPLKVAQAKVGEERVVLTSASYLGTGHSLSRRLHTANNTGHRSRKERKAAAEDPGYRIFVRFSSWLASALIYSQSQVPSMENATPDNHKWEQVFVDYMVYLYLPLEFENCVSSLLREWLLIWMRMNHHQASQSANLLVMLPFQQKLFGRLSLMQPKGESTLLTKPTWTLVFGCLHQVLEQISNDAAASISSAIEVINDTFVKFDLIELSITWGLSGADNHSLPSTLDAFDAICTHSALSEFSSAEVVHFLQYPLELIAFCYISADQDDETLTSQWMLARILTALESIFAPAGKTRKFAEEVTAYWSDYMDKLNLKYAYLEPVRSQEFFLATTELVCGQKATTKTRKRKTPRLS
ncbi:hypothetical protein FI667_g4177, partial [Globisporangium splendens]